MDEKGMITIRERGKKHADNCMPQYMAPDSHRIRRNSYIQGALDQDPISRKKRTEEILHIIDFYQNDLPLHPDYKEAWSVMKKIRSDIEALP